LGWEYYTHFVKGKGERNLEKGRGDDPYWSLSPQDLRDIEKAPNSTPNQRESKAY